MPRPDDIAIACQQVLLEDASVFSLQAMTLPPEMAGGLTPQRLLERYLRHIRRFTGTLVRPAADEGGIDFRLLGSDLSLIRFSGPEFTEGPQSRATLRICGGLLVQAANCDRGELSFACERLDEGMKVTLLVSDFCPLLLGGPRPHRLRKWLYRLTQAALHKLVTVHFLRRLHRELAGRKVCCKVVKVRIREGEEI